MAGAHIKSTLTRHGSNHDTRLDMGCHSTEVQLMCEGRNGQDNHIRSRNDFFRFVGNFDGLSILVRAKVIDAPDAFLGHGSGKSVCFAWER